MRNAIFATLAVVGVALSWGYFQSGSFATTLPYLAGEELVMLPSALDLGERTAGGAIEESVTFRNISSEPITVVGMQRTCSCIASNTDLPMTIPPYGEARIEFSISLPKKPTEKLRQKVVFFTDCKSRMFLSVEVHGKVI